MTNWPKLQLSDRPSSKSSPHSSRGPGISLSSSLAWPLLTVVGGMCYTIYLYHNILLPHVNHLAHGVVAGTAAIGRLIGLSGEGVGWVAAEMIVRAGVLLAGVVAVSAVGFWLFEKPFMHRDWPKTFAQWLRRRRRSWFGAA